MPALPSSPRARVIGHLAAVTEDAGDGVPGLLAVLARARSFTAIAEWAADADEQTLATLGVTGAVPSESTLGQVEVGAKTNEIPLFSALLDRIDMTGAPSGPGWLSPTPPRPSRSCAAAR